ncbi:unnamed protein product [Clonostachys rosea]|uniref:Uncharacterized protein n=1 Tax=Bionectria ochroleuca TaxID=29856 RepID=A0ABY6UDF0_BIOOC|nr:unnamed protein product [Clonostachys rosea]
MTQHQMDVPSQEKLHQEAKLLREPIDEEVKKTLEGGKSDNDLDATFWSGINATTRLAVGGHSSLAAQEFRLYDLWYVCIQAAKTLHCASLKQDSIVRYIMSAKAMGPLRGVVPSVGDGSNTVQRGEIITFSDGRRFWSDLPLFGLDLEEEFTNRYYQSQHYEKDQRMNFAAFIGRLLSVGIYDGPAVCALSLFRETLETHRPLVSSAKDRGAEEDEVLPVEDLLNALQQLLHHSEASIAILSNIPGAASTTPNVGLPNFLKLASLGEQARQAGIVDAPSGYSAERLRFWFQRLEELSQCDVKSIASDAETCLHTLITAQESIGTYKADIGENGEERHVVSYD